MYSSTCCIHLTNNCCMHVLMCSNGWGCKRVSGCRPSTLTACSITGCAGMGTTLGGCKVNGAQCSKRHPQEL
jgi:hypothetical protein